MQTLTLSNFPPDGDGDGDRPEVPFGRFPCPALPLGWGVVVLLLLLLGPGSAKWEDACDDASDSLPTRLSSSESPSADTTGCNTNKKFISGKYFIAVEDFYKVAPTLKWNITLICGMFMAAPQAVKKALHYYSCTDKYTLLEVLNALVTLKL